MAIVGEINLQIENLKKTSVKHTGTQNSINLISKRAMPWAKMVCKCLEIKASICDVIDAYTNKQTRCTRVQIPSGLFRILDPMVNVGCFEPAIAI